MPETRVRYRAELPWIGPVLGARDPKGGRWIGAAWDPLLGQSLAAVFVTVKQNGARRLEIVDSNGGAAKFLQVARIAWFRADSEGRFRVRTDVDGLSPGVRTLMALLYDRSGSLMDPNDIPARRRSHQYPARWRPRVQKSPVDESGEEAVADQPTDEQAEIERSMMAELLARRAADLEAGLVEPPPTRNSAAPFSFAVASCQYPSGFLDRRVAESSYACLENVVKECTVESPRSLLLVGDQIYSDATAGLFDPTTKFDRFDEPHERLLRSRPVRGVLRRIPAFTMLDDHEIQDNWEPLPDATEEDPVLVEGRRAYLAYQRIAGPAPLPSTPDCPNPLWYDFELDGFAFFMADSRTERQARTAETVHEASIMSERQFGMLLKWLDDGQAHDADRPRFVATPACLLPRHVRARQWEPLRSALQSDSWDGYPRSLYRLLAHLAKAQMRNVVFLSGDEHISFVADITVVEHSSGKEASVRSIHSSGLYSPFPFANSIPEALSSQDSFTFDVGGADYTCCVRTRMARKGDGFCLVSVAKGNGRWDVTPTFLPA